MDKIVYTAGTSNRTLEEFILLLKVYKIKNVIDVRRFPTSKRFPHFKKESLETTLREKGFFYIYLGKELGGYRKGGYENYIKTPDFKSGLEKLEELALKEPSIFFCCEKFPWKCHRRFIADALLRRGWTVIHILDRERTLKGEKLTFLDDTPYTDGKDSP